MVKFGYKESVYAYMIAVADLDGKITPREKQVMDHFFDKTFDFPRLSDRRKKRIGLEIKPSMDMAKFEQMVIENLKKFKPKNQMKAYNMVTKFINVNYPNNQEARNVCKIIRDQLTFTDKEYDEIYTWGKKDH